MDRKHERGIQADCVELLYAFIAGIDSGDADAAAMLFAPEGVWDRQGVSLRGPDEIRAALHKRAPGLVTRHMLANPRVRVVDADHANATAYYAVYRGERATGQPGPLPLQAPDRMGDYVASFARAVGGWKIMHIAANRAFAR